MTVQIVEIAGQKMAMLPIADYERLLDVIDEKADIAAAIAAEQRRHEGEEYLPAALVDRILAGESPLRVWRLFRNLTLKELSSAANISLSMLQGMEVGDRRGKPSLWRDLATALNVSADDILPES